MTSISDVQFTEAMQRAVDKRGGDWTYPKASASYYPSGQPVYSTTNGLAACLIGAAMDEAGLTRPDWMESRSALAVLDGKVSVKVGLSARAAQIHQDAHNPWSECLAIYMEAMKVCDEHEAAVGACTVMHGTIVYMEARERVTGVARDNRRIEMLTAIEAAHEELKKFSVAFEKIDVPPTTFSYMTGGLLTLPEVSVPNGGVIGHFAKGTKPLTANTVTVLKQADHALTA